ncbi:rhodanese-like domain-containing protein [Geomonas subterranea]|uniref:Rhodanese-like domain-containing protein n=1 Tax=Geomonas subterranea TaxID=2847989 RepID=A0ABX8LPA5_9BACT|nr:MULTISPECIES: rhodanese-like domain-containing protein [Geomonas]QXE92078.1 rhodanese-like domain-containing protein [Geomonas subterranea]QXM09829.1 rhodanese-like domain-containing protein [Geomonas subterranea]
MKSFTRFIGTSVLSLLALFLVLTAAMPLFAAEAEFKTVSSEALRDMLEEKRAFTLVDARTSDEYQVAHLVSAISIPDKEFDKHIALLPKDKGALIVFYCNGVKCGKSKKVAAKAKEAGYTNLVIYPDGFPVWEEKGYPIVAGAEYAKKIETTKFSPAKLKEILAEKKDAYVLVDVRDEFEFAEGHIEGAINIPAETFAAKSGVLPKEKGIIVYCNSGGRSYSAYRKLMKLAYPSIFQAILAEWKEAGFPVVKSQL